MANWVGNNKQTNTVFVSTAGRTLLTPVTWPDGGVFVPAITVSVALSLNPVPGVLNVVAGSAGRLEALGTLSLLAGFRGIFTVPLTAELVTTPGTPTPTDLPYQPSPGAGYVGLQFVSGAGFTTPTDDTVNDGKQLSSLSVLPAAGSATARPYAVALLSALSVLPYMPEEELAAFGWDSAQTALTGAPVGTPQVTSVEWHHTTLDEHVGAFAVAREGGPLEDAVGDVIKVSYGNRSLLAYVVDVSDELVADLSLARRSFLELADLALDGIMASVELTSVAAS